METPQPAEGQVPSTRWAEASEQILRDSEERRRRQRATALRQRKSRLVSR